MLWRLEKLLVLLGSKLSGHFVRLGFAESTFWMVTKFSEI